MGLLSKLMSGVLTSSAYAWHYMGMKNTNRSNPVTAVMNEYIPWGGPVITRAEAYADMKARGFDAKAIDISVFGRQAIPAPEDPAAHLAFFRRIQEMEAARS